MARPTMPITLLPEYSDLRHRIARGRETPHSLAPRALMTLPAAEGRPNKTIAGELGICEETDGFWRKRRLNGQSELARRDTPNADARWWAGCWRIGRGRGVRAPLVRRARPRRLRHPATMGIRHPAGILHEA